jgi:O-antigen/teichoic acid export membrane protein
MPRGRGKVEEESRTPGLALVDMLALDEPLRVVLSAVLRGGEVSTAEAAQVAGMTAEAAGEALETLTSRGQLQAVGDGDELRYRARHARRRRHLPGWVWWRADELLALLSRGSRTALAIQVGGAVLDYLVHLLLARWLGPIEFGRYAYQLGWSQLLVTFAWLGITRSSGRFIPAYSVERDWSHLRGWVDGGRAAVFLAGALLALAALGWISAAGQGRPPGPVQLVGFGLVPLLTLMTAHQWMLRAGKSRFWEFAPTHLFFRLFLGLGAGLLRLGQGGLSALGALAATGAACAATLAFQVPALTRILPKETWSAVRKYDLPLWTRVGVPIYAISVCSVALLQVDLVLLGLFRGAQETGVYSAAMKVSEFALFFHLGLSSAVVPLIVPVFKRGDQIELQRMLDTFARVSLVPNVVICAAVIALGQPLLHLYGGDFAAGYPAVVMLTLTHFANAATGPTLNLLMLTGSERAASGVFVLSTVVAVAIHAALIPRWGVQGAAVGSVISALLWNAAFYALVVRLTGVRSFLFSRSAWR